MAGIGFGLLRLAQRGGLLGMMAAGAHGAFVTSGPWLLAAASITILQRWLNAAFAPEDAHWINTIITYAFGASAVVAAPVIGAVTRMVADRLFANDRDAIPGILSAALATATALALFVGAVLFGLLGRLAALDQWLAIALLTLLAQIWVASLFLTAIEQFRQIVLAYVVGLASGLLAGAALSPDTPRAVLAIMVATTLLVETILVRAIRRNFTGPSIWPGGWIRALRGRAQIAAATLAGAVALWVDKWLLWFDPANSVALVGHLRLNPIYDTGSFLGLLSLVPGLTLLLIVVETRFEQAFGRFMNACLGTATDRTIEANRVALSRTLLENIRLLALTQSFVASLLWLLAPYILAAVDADPRAIFSFRLTVLGAVFHLLVIQATVVLSYMDLFGRILLIWTVFALTSALVTVLGLDSGFAAYGWGYLAGAICGASTAAIMVAQATRTLVFLVFVGNNPAVAGTRRQWA